ncbi:kinase-like protein [Coccomyxa subellipsoidea C-169]|uniref:mitogen-activated protein kinase kinase n=1 Tax=Coccomyxa subellipsoidea (strain C-169) TaxID=574566 RepID=I0YRC9_COCSC|nr:kinase-like protein [Coccomyxa subellipsoidea C-169]EIE20948.1 kinase-like protein [Coccomyxa subellipsoidea C-169]|eukprot:XP_005645492.1 kinase-like protein [Coccomyxa subellipsoidea C-169]
MRIKKCFIPCIGRPLVLDNDGHQSKQIQLDELVQIPGKPPPSAGASSSTIHIKVEAGVRDVAVEEATQLRQRPSALEELHKKETVHTTTKLMQKATAEAEARRAVQEAAQLRQQMSDADTAHKKELEQMAAAEAEAKEDAQAARTAAKTQTGLLKEKEVDLAAAQAVIWQKDDRISQLEQKEERWQKLLRGRDAEIEELQRTQLEQQQNMCRLPEGSCKETGDLGSGSWALVKSVTVSFRVAAKVARTLETDEASAQAKEDLQKEGQVLCALPPHPNVVQVIGWARLDNRLFGTSEEGLIMEKACCSLSDMLKDGPIETCKVLPIVLGMCKGLAHVWGHGYIHRDIKPPNILMGPDGCAQLADFGLAMRNSEQCTKFGGTLLYSTPRSFVRDTGGAQDDTRGLCMTTYELLTGRSIKDELTDQFNALSEDQKQRVADLCQKIDEDELDGCVQAVAAEYLKLIGITQVVPLDERVPAELLEDILMGIRKPRSLPLSRLQASIEAAMSKISLQDRSSGEQASDEEDSDDEEGYCTLEEANVCDRFSEN